MDSLNIVAISCIILMILTIICVIIVAMTSSSKRYMSSRGVNSKGVWKIVATDVGALPSYYFFDYYLINEAGNYLLVDGNRLSLTQGTPAKVTFNAPFMTINGLYVNLDQSNNFILEPIGRTTYLFDAYNFYLTSNLSTTRADILSSINTTLTPITNPNLYMPPAPTIGKWTLAVWNPA